MVILLIKNTMFWFFYFEILNLEGHQNRFTASRVTAILLNGWILLIGGASAGESLPRLVYTLVATSFFPCFLLFSPLHWDWPGASLSGPQIRPLPRLPHMSTLSVSKECMVAQSQAGVTVTVRVWCHSHSWENLLAPQASWQDHLNILGYLLANK